MKRHWRCQAEFGAEGGAGALNARAPVDYSASFVSAPGPFFLIDSMAFTAEALLA